MALTLPPSRNYRSHYSRQGKELPQSYYLEISCNTQKAKKKAAALSTPDIVRAECGIDRARRIF